MNQRTGKIDIDPEKNEHSWFVRHPAVTTFTIMFLIIAAGTALHIVKNEYFPSEVQEFKNPVFLNHTFEEVDILFSVNSNMTEKEQDDLFDSEYRYNVFKWSCKPIGCHDVVGQPTLKLVCKEYGYTEDVRILMKEECGDVADKSQVTVVFQLMSKTTGEYYLGRSGTVVEN
ncbi:hypothetical protein HQ545_05900 [Candidatus Woesearchaeota archaeon]|nr:hypothetical protein [Candidatus Woesearchaeota archaeon]